MAASIEGTFRLIDAASGTLDKLQASAKLTDKALKGVGERLDKIGKTHVTATVGIKGDKETDQKLDRMIAKLDEFGDRAPNATLDLNTAGFDASLARANLALTVFARRHATATAGVNSSGGAGGLGVGIGGGGSGGDRSSTFNRGRRGGIVGAIGSIPFLGRPLAGLAGVVEGAFSKAMTSAADATGNLAAQVEKLGESAGTLQPLVGKAAEGVFNLGVSFESAAASGGGPAGLVAALVALLGIIGVVMNAIIALTGAVVALGASFVAAIGGAALVTGGGLLAFLAGVGSIASIVLPAVKAITELKKAQDKLKTAEASGDPTQIKKAQKDLNDLSRQHKGLLGVASALDRVKTRWERLTRPGQRLFGKAITATLHDLTPLLRSLAGMANKNFKAFYDAYRRYVLPALKSHEFRSFLAALSRTFRSLAGPVTKGFRDLFVGIGRLIRLALPDVKRFGDGFARLMHSFRAWTKTPEARKFVRDLVHSFREWLDLIRAVLELIGRLTKAGKGQGDSLIVSLTKFIDKIGRNPRALQKWIKDAVHDFRSIVHIVSVFAGVLIDLGNAVQKTHFFEFWSRLFDAVSSLKGPLSMVVDLFGEIPDIIPDFGGGKTVKTATATGVNIKGGPLDPKADPKARKPARPRAAEAVKALGGRAVEKLLDSKHPVSAAQKTRTQVAHVFSELARDVQGSWQRMTTSIRARLSQISAIFRTQTKRQGDLTTLAYRKIRDNSSHAMEAAAKRIDSALSKLSASFDKWTGKMLRTTHTNFAAIITEMNHALKAMGVSPHAATGTAAIPGVGPATTKPKDKKASGGRIAGRGLLDTVAVSPNAMAAPGELIVNRHTERRVNRMLGHHGTTLGAQVDGETTPHSAPLKKRRPHTDSYSYAKGGRTPSLMGSKPGLGLYAQIGQRYGLSVVSGSRPGAITSSGNTSLHASGDAIDVDAGSKQGMLAYARFLSLHYGKGINELIHTPLGKLQIKDGQNYVYSGQVASDHYDHVHVGDRTPAGGGPLGAGLAGGGDIQVHQMRKRKVSGVPGVFGQVAQLAVNKVIKGAQSVLDKNAGAGGGMGGLLPAGAGGTVGASMFGGPGDPGTGSTGYKGDNLNAKPDSYAELDMGKALGGLPYMQRLRVTGPKGSMMLYKRDIGAGGGPVNGHHRAIDLWYQAAQNLGVSGLGLVKVQKAAKGGRVSPFAEGGRVPFGGWYGQGGEFTAHKPMMVGVGDRGPEKVKVTPISKQGPTGKQGVGAKSIHVEIHRIDYRREGDIKKAVEKELSGLAEDLDLVSHGG